MRFRAPTNLTPVAGSEAFFTILMAVVIAGVLIWAARRREWMLFVLLPAAAVSSFIEPIYDFVGIAWWSNRATSVFTVFGTHIFNPLLFPLGYVMWVGLGTYFSYWIFQHRWDRRRVVRVFIVLALCEPALEYPWLWTHLLSYYGPQPFKLFGYSVLWNAINTAGVAATGAALLWLKDTGRLEGRGIRHVATLPFAMIGVYVIVGSPGWFVMHIDNVPTVVMWIGGSITLFLGHHITVGCIDWVDQWNARRRETPAITHASAHRGTVHTRLDATAEHASA
jgi:hypothetical protein